MTREGFDAEWDRCSPWLEAGLQFCHGAYLIDDVKHIVMTDPDTQFWPGKRSAAVSQILHNPRLTQLHFWLCGGELDEIVDEMFPVAEAWGVTQGCSRFSTAGRQGWRRVLKPLGYMLAYEVCYKDLTA